ncbi:hypothetical protein PoB_004325200 [Plakobranchus ocellatus]|uniref:Uncharacterized protein n=1 Tax=Plakobranchus ocellatus TaxID=259542 RepID=A0AAV4BBE9_9GAST|nr:hypothetical protein PoB_004325200 [Plakobranchus ocellatus]
MDRQRNTRNTFPPYSARPCSAAKRHGSSSAVADIGQLSAFGQNMRNRLLSFPAQATHGSDKATVSHTVRQEERLPRS